MKKFASNIDLLQNAILNAVMHPLASAPSSPQEGQMYFNSTSHVLYYWDGTQWVGGVAGALVAAMFTANSILKADSAGDPGAMTVTEGSVIGRAAGGVISALTIDTDLTSVSANDDTIPSAKATKAYADTKQSALTFGIADTNALRVNDAAAAVGEFARFTASGLEGRSVSQTQSDLDIMPLSYLDTDVSLAANSDTNVPSQKAVKSYVDGMLTLNAAMVYQGPLDCASNPDYPEAFAGWTYLVSVAGRIGGASGVQVDVGDLIVCNTQNSGGTQAAVGANWNVLEHNIVGAVIGPAASTDSCIVLFDGVTGKVVKDSAVTIASLQNQNANHTGDVTGATALTITNKAVTLAKMADLAANSIIGNNTGAAGVPLALNASQVRTLLNVADGATANTGTVVKVEADIGNGSASSFTVTHNLNTRGCIVQIFDNSTYEQIEVDVVRSTVNAVQIQFGTVVPTTNQYHVVIMA